MLIVSRSFLIVFRKKIDEFKKVILENDDFLTAKTLVIPNYIAFMFLLLYCPELNSAENIGQWTK